MALKATPAAEPRYSLDTSKCDFRNHLQQACFASLINNIPQTMNLQLRKASSRTFASVVKNGAGNWKVGKHVAVRLLFLKWK